MSVKLVFPQSRTPAVEKNEYEMSVELALPHSRTPVACEQAPGGASAEQTARRFAPNVCSALAPPGACSQASTPAVEKMNMK